MVQILRWVILKPCAVLEQIEQMHAAEISLEDSSPQLVLRSESKFPDNLLTTSTVIKEASIFYKSLPPLEIWALVKVKI